MGYLFAWKSEWNVWKRQRQTELQLIVMDDEWRRRISNLAPLPISTSQFISPMKVSATTIHKTIFHQFPFEDQLVIYHFLPPSFPVANELIEAVKLQRSTWTYFVRFSWTERPINQVATSQSIQTSQLRCSRRWLTDSIQSQAKVEDIQSPIIFQSTASDWCEPFDARKCI